MRISREPRGPEQQRLTWAKLAVAGVGLFIWAYGARVHDANVRWVGIAIFALAFVLRFLGRRSGREG